MKTKWILTVFAMVLAWCAQAFMVLLVGFPLWNKVGYWLDKQPIKKGFADRATPMAQRRARTMNLRSIRIDRLPLTTVLVLIAHTPKARITIAPPRLTGVTAHVGIPARLIAMKPHHQPQKRYHTTKCTWRVAVRYAANNDPFRNSNRRNGPSTRDDTLKTVVQ